MSTLKGFNSVSDESRHFAQEFQGYYTEIIFAIIESCYNEVIISDNNFGTNLAIRYILMLFLTKYIRMPNPNENRTTIWLLNPCTIC